MIKEWVDISPLGPRYDEMRRRNRAHNVKAVALRHYKVKCSRCKRIMAYGPVKNTRGICSECQPTKENTQ